MMKRAIEQRMAIAVGIAFGSALPVAGAAGAGPDVVLCQLYSLGEPSAFSGGGRDLDSGTVGLTAATRSRNIGTANLNWYTPYPEGSGDPRHPFISLNMYRLLNGRFEQIGVNFPKHGYFATSDTDCDNDALTCSGVPAGNQLGVGCDDLYSAGNNASRPYLGPRFEINPWTGVWDPSTSVLYDYGSIEADNYAERRLRVKESDLTTFTATVNPTGVMYFYEAMYITADDVNAANNAGWKQVTAISFNGTRWTLSSSGATTAPNAGWAIDAWTIHAGARQTLVAQQLPIVDNVPQNPAETWSPDGRAIIASKVSPNGDGTFRYEYAVMNVDMDRQIGSFRIPVPCGVQVTNVGASGVMHWNEPTHVVGGKAIDNTPWAGTLADGAVTWSTPAIEDEEPSNPIRWGMLFNFWFDASTDKQDGMATIGLFKPPPPGGPVAVFGMIDTPTMACPGDADCDFIVTFGDVIEILSNFGAVYLPGSGEAGDSNNDGDVDFDDVLETLANFNQDCL